MTPIIAVILLLTSAWLAAGEPPNIAGQGQKDIVRKDASGTAKVTVEVMKTEGKEGPDVKVQVQGNGIKQDTAGKNGPTILPVPGEKLTPIEAEKINKIGRASCRERV